MLQSTDVAFACLYGITAHFHMWWCGYESHKGDLGALATKLIPIALLVFYSYSTRGRHRPVHHIGAALGGVGDAMIALSAQLLPFATIPFGLGHLAYASLIRRPPRAWMPAVTALLIANLAVGVVAFLPFYSRHPGPVLMMATYGLVLSAVAALAFSSAYYRSGFNETATLFGFRYFQASRLLAAGYLSFVISDSVLILHGRVLTIPFGEPLIISTYYLAQLLIYWGIRDS